MDAHPDRHVAGHAGLMQADAYAGFNRLYETNANQGRSSRQALCESTMAPLHRRLFRRCRPALLRSSAPPRASVAAALGGVCNSGLLERALSAALHGPRGIYG
jgi:hypothetical protein